MSRPPDRLSERAKILRERDQILHEMSSVIMMVEQDTECVARHVAPDGQEALDSLRESSRRLVGLFRRLREICTKRRRRR
jgi:hypothetical protein